MQLSTDTLGTVVPADLAQNASDIAHRARGPVVIHKAVHAFPQPERRAQHLRWELPAVGCASGDG